MKRLIPIIDRQTTPSNGDDSLVENDNKSKKAPYAVVILRIILTPGFFYAFILDFTEIAILIYIAVFASDIADGLLAKNQDTPSSSPLEAYLDPVADFIFVLVSFYAFSLRQFYPIWILAAFVSMFLFFVISSGKKKPLYDPVGKYYGTFLFLAVGVTLFLPTEIILTGVLVLVLVYTLALAVYRTVYIWDGRTK